MTGICGYCGDVSSNESPLLDVMLDALNLGNGIGRSAYSRDGLGMGGTFPKGNNGFATVKHVHVVADADLVGSAIDGNTGGNLNAFRQDSANSAAEIIANLYLERGARFLVALRGGFSLALWDDREKRLILAIDGFGLKSMYWRQEGDRLLFGSRLRAIRAAQQDPLESNPRSILQFFLFSAVPAPLSSDAGTQKLEPGSALTYAGGKTRIERYWDLRFSEEPNRTVEEWSKDLRGVLRNAVHAQTRGCTASDIGCFLSGGTDSSSVVAFTSEILQPTQAFTIIFREAGFTEADFARTAARHFNARHYEKVLFPQDASAAIEKIVNSFDEPFANSSAIGSYYCADLARERGIRTLLAGDGGDELFAGNERYASDKRFALYSDRPQWIRTLIERMVRILPAKRGTLNIPQRYIRRASLRNPLRILSYGFFLSLPPEEVFESGFLDQIGSDPWLAIPEAHFRRVDATSELNRLLYLDLKMTLADNDLRKVSNTAELLGLRVRYPFLDREVAEFSARIPASLKLRGFQKRYIFKQAMKGILPNKILYKKKHGFGVPMAQWLLGDARMKAMMDDILHDRRTRQRGLFRPDFYSKLMRLHQQQPNFFGEIVWYILVLELWYRRHAEVSRQPIHAK